MATLSNIEERVGRAAHERWKLWIVSCGYADHAFERASRDSFSWSCKWCPDFNEHKHHEDMVPWEQLPEEKRGKYVGQGMAGYEIGLAEGRGG